MSVKHLFSFVAFLSVFFLLLTRLVYAEEISHFQLDATVREDGKVAVTETISYDFGQEERHGIYRTIPLTKENIDGEVYKMEIEDIAVTDEYGEPYIFDDSLSSHILNVKIGDPDKTISGKHTYILSYLIGGALTYFSDHDEWYWNVTGNGWDVPIGSVSATIALPGTIDTSQLQLACFTGEEASEESRCVYRNEGNKVYFEGTDSFNSNEGMTVVVGFPKGAVSVLEPTPVADLSDSPFAMFITFLLGFAWYIVLPGYIIYRWYKQGRDPKSTVGQANVWFAVPKLVDRRELTPAELSVLLTESVSPKALTGTIVDLAHKGYITMVQEGKDVLLQSTHKTHTLLPHESTVLNAIFAKGESVSSKSLTLYSAFSTVQKNLSKNAVQTGLFVKNPQMQKDFYMVLGAVGLFTGNIFLFLTAIIFGRSMPRRTQFGTDLAATGRALKKFLSSQEHQYTFQAKELYLFEKMLPYAVALGVEKLWAERFEDSQVPPPSWYSGDTFTPVVFANSLHSSFSTVEKTMAGSSSTGHSSGFSGGSSGGGGGGGGGGSW